MEGMTSFVHICDPVIAGVSIYSFTHIHSTCLPNTIYSIYLLKSYFVGIAVLHSRVTAEKVDKTSVLLEFAIYGKTAS